ncbi:electron transport protein SCO1/SenC [Amaricoccus sp. HAR-UPW-R2A-40]|jgi:protein SCO1/2|nr:electron transport protein SCO1/SenC [Amaricoccus sp. HAR-UPW-R2A-40]
MRRRTLIFSVASALGAAVGTLALGAWRSGRMAPEDPYRPLPLDRMNWQLTDHAGRSVAAADWLGRPTMVFFGFTWCPDVCPTTLSDISLWLEELGPEADQLLVALITVDPARDTPAALADYLSSFDPRIRGLTGSQSEIARAAEGFRVRYERVPQDGSYTMNHTAGVFLFDRGGRFVSVIDFHEDRRYALPKLRRILN